MRVLVADDDLGSRLVAQSAVSARGHECITAADGDEAWRLMEQFRPDVLVTDRDMPGLDGMTLCRRIRESEQHGYTYIVLVTSLDDPDQVTIGMQAGADDYLTKPLNPFALQTRLLAAARVTRLHAELGLAREALVRQAHTDPLTGLSNRLGLADDLEQLHHVSERYGHSFCLAMCDIDHFKAYNDTYGHPAGDQVLRIVATTIRDQVRSGDRVYRYGGEEFLILLPQQSAGDALAALERVRSQLHGLAVPHRGVGPAAVLTISAGLAACEPGRRTSSSSLLAAADTALYQAKRSGRDCVAQADRAETPVGISARPRSSPF